MWLFLSLVTLSGWVSSERQMGKQLSFVALRDGKGTTQLQLVGTGKMQEVLEEHNLTG